MVIESVKAFFLRDGYSGKGRGLTGWYRELTVREAKQLRYGTLYAVDRNGRVRECRLNGAPKTWKTRPGCVLSLKYGLKECFNVGGDDRQDDESVSRSHDVCIVVPVKASFAEDAPPQVVADYVMEHEMK
jgi:hypothetical protein